MRRPMLVLLLLTASTAALAQFPLPRRPRIEIPIEIPGLDKILKQEPPLTTSIDDAKTEAPFLDDFDPQVLYPMAQLPVTPDAAYVMVAPGVYELDARSYCLNAGASSPGESDGALYAPVKGPWAGIIRNILRNSMFNGDIPQEDIQSLLWAILARTKISDLSPELQRVAARLLTTEEIFKINGGALGLISEELREKAFGHLPPLVRRSLEAEAELRELFTQGSPSFEELERVAVVRAVAPEQEGGREVPRGRWSYHPDGYFIRYFPHGYSRTVTQLYVPEPFDIQADENGRITSVQDQRGNRIELAYDDTVDALTVAGDGNLRAYAFGSIRFIAPDPQQPGQTRQAEWTGRGWTFVGTPSGRGRPEQEHERFADVTERYQLAAEQHRQLMALAQEIQRLHSDAMTGDALQAMLRDITDLGECAVALKAALGEDLPDEQSWALSCVNLLKRAWATGVCSLAEGGGEGREAEQVRQEDPKPVRLAALGRLTGIGRQSVSEVSYGRLAFGGGGGWGAGPSPRKPRPLPKFDPSSGEGVGKKTKQPSGQSGKPFGDTAQAARKTRRALRVFRRGKMAADIAFNPVGAGASMIGFAIPRKMAGYIVDWNVSTWSTATAALGGEDPPRSDYAVVARPEPIDFVPLEPGPDLPAARAQALNAMMAAACDLTSKLRAGMISMDRYGGAMEADDMGSADKQAEAVVKFKRAAGAAMIVVADRLDAVVRELRGEGFVDISVTAESLRRYQERIRTQGFSPEEIEAAHATGLTDEEIEAVRQERIAADPQEVAGSLFAAEAEVAPALRELGAIWMSLPAPAYMPVLEEAP